MSFRCSIRRSASAGSTATMCCPRWMSSIVSRPVPAPTSAIRSTSCGSQSTTPGWSRSARASRSYSSGSRRYSSSQARTMSFCGSPLPAGTNRLASSRVNAPRSAAVYRLRNSLAAPAGTPESSAPSLAGGAGGSGSDGSGSGGARSEGAGSGRAQASGLVTDFSPVLVGLPDPDRAQQPIGKLWPQPLPACLGQVFASWDEPLEPRDVGVQVAVIHVADDLRADDVRQRFQVQDIAGGRIDLAGHDNLQHIVVTVQVHTLPEQAPVLVIGQARIVQLVRGIE